ncbi:hypothetical protein SKAU_G00394210 [Synaphobranchus kaupii]|uniref:Uncharacterized protein n=1 Tax=Synaphobranchus kaupii TaxID=118154 RepID=A0A9Q1EC39_SYNKA|nr:hypothetical protein SKAU_G00394210 [Synaphobranchus kaupii]
MFIPNAVQNNYRTYPARNTQPSSFAAAACTVIRPLTVFVHVSLLYFAMPSRGVGRVSCRRAERGAGPKAKGAICFWSFGPRLPVRRREPAIILSGVLG